MNMRVKRNRILCAVCASLLLLSGCGRAEGENMSATDGQKEARSGSMGRYMETVSELPEEINRNGGLNRLADGTFSIISYNGGLYMSKDGGESWHKEEAAWFPMIQGVYCLSAVMGPDGTVAATCSGEMPPAAREACKEEVPEGWEGNYCVFVFPDGSVKIADYGFTQEDGTCIAAFRFREDGRLFASDISGRIYEVHIDADSKEKNPSLEELFAVDGQAGYMDFSGDTLMTVGRGRLYLYDLEEGALRPRDETADEFIRRELPDGTVSYTGGGYPLAVFGSGEEDTIYIVCGRGMYRHALGGSVMEQIIDGALTTFGDSTATLYHVEALENQEFMAQFNGSSGLVRYTWDGSVPSMPDKEIRIYSLEENRSVRQAVTAFKKEHTDMYVRYEVGLNGENGVTAEDAKKKLNAQVLAGEGPDVLVLDGLPFDSYVEKGMLQDLSGVLDGMDEELFSNIRESFKDKETGKIYAMPLCIRVPLLAGDKELIAGMEGLSSFADGMEALRERYPEGGLLGIYDAEPLLALFAQVSCSAWTDESGQMDASAVQDFLTQMKRIYDAEMAGAVQEEVDAVLAEEKEMAGYGTDVVQYRKEACNNVLGIPRGYAKIACGYVESIQLCLDNVTTAVRGGENLDFQLFGGQETAAFIPRVMVGISARTGRQEEAEVFVRKMFSAETQEHIYEGFPINRAAFEAHFAAMEENADNGSMKMTCADGTEMEFRLSWPSREEQQKFTEYVETLANPVAEDEYLCALVNETGVQVLEGNISVEEGLSEISKKAAVYFAE